MQDFKKCILQDIGEKRYNHTLGVVKTAEELALVYGCDIEKAKTAALFHDCAKVKDLTSLLKMARDFDIILDEKHKKNPELIHAELGSKIAEQRYGIEDREILDAIKYHTTGRENMGLLEKIIYIADSMEPGRDYPGVDKLRQLTYSNIDKAILMSMGKTIKYLVEKNQLIDLETVKARNYLLLEEKSEEDD